MESLLLALLSNALAVTVLAGLVAGLSKVCRRPALIHSLWLVVLLKLITPPIVPMNILSTSWLAPSVMCTTSALVDDDVIANPHRPEPAYLPADQSTWLRAESLSRARTNTRQGIEMDMGESSPELRIAVLSTPQGSVAFTLPPGWKWEHLALISIGLGAVSWWALATVRIIRFEDVLRDVQPIPGDWQTRADELAARVGLVDSPTICLVPGRVPPMLWAMGRRPRLLLPVQLWATICEDERTSLLLHELAQLKRRDHWVRWFELIVVGLYWWHPVVWWVRRELREAEEQCCDAWVVWAMPQKAKTYAAALLAALEFVSCTRTPAGASAIGATGHVSCLKRRLRMILHAKTPKALSWAGRLGVLGVAALLLPLAPSWARQNEPQQPRAEQDPTRHEARDDVRNSQAEQPDKRHLDEQLEARIKEEPRRIPS